MNIIRISKSKTTQLNNKFPTGLATGDWQLAISRFIIEFSDRLSEHL